VLFCIGVLRNIGKKKKLLNFSTLKVVLDKERRFITVSINYFFENFIKIGLFLRYVKNFSKFQYRGATFVFRRYSIVF
jgi:hypothetical protein